MDVHLQRCLVQMMLLHMKLHGVTQQTANLVYRSQSGALNESFQMYLVTSLMMKIS